MSIFSTRLKELRNQANLSQQELSKIIGISKSSINMYERGEREPGLETVGALADYFDVQTDYLLGKNDDTRSPKKAKKYNKLIIQTIEDYRLRLGYDRKQMEDLFDWDDMYFDLESGMMLGDEGLLKTFQSLTSINATIPDDFKSKENSPSEPSLTEGEQLLLDLFRQIPEDKQELVLGMIRAALGSSK
jgi:transcriptional regulator with XRE-family HTH domain